MEHELSDLGAVSIGAWPPTKNLIRETRVTPGAVGVMTAHVELLREPPGRHYPVSAQGVLHASSVGVQIKCAAFMELSMSASTRQANEGLACIAADMLKAYISRTQPRASFAAGEFSMWSVSRTQSSISCASGLPALNEGHVGSDARAENSTPFSVESFEGMAPQPHHCFMQDRQLSSTEP